MIPGVQKVTFKRTNCRACLSRGCSGVTNMQRGYLDPLLSSGKSVFETFCGKGRCEIYLLYCKLQEKQVDHSAFRSLQAQADKSPKATNNLSTPSI